MTKDLEMVRLPWMISVGPQNNHRSPRKAEAKGDLAGRTGGNVPALSSCEKLEKTSDR